MAELSRENVTSLFSDVLPAASLQSNLRPPATPQNARKAVSSSGPPPKCQKYDKPKGGGKGKPKDRRQREESNPSSLGNAESQLIPLMAQLCLKNEDAINILRMDKAYVMMFKTKGEETMLPTIKDLETRWQELRDAGKTECSKRIALFKGVILELQTRAKALLERDEKIKLLINLGWLTQQEQREPMWQPLVWSVASQKDIPCPDLGPLPHTQAMRCLDIILEHATSQIVQRFHSTRPLAREYRGEVMEFLLEVSLQGPTPESSRGTGTAEQLRALVPCGSQIEARGPQEVLGGEQAAAPTCRQVLTLSLRNPGNLCYQNAFVMSWLWSITNATHQVREHGDGLGRSAPLVSALLSGNHNRLSGIFHWSSILQGWSRPQIQHDVAAFATHALTRLRSPVMYGTWYAKREDPHCRVVDEGPLHLPLPIAIPAEAATLQECLDSWHQQDALHAVGVAPPLLALQLGRCRHRAHRHVRKYQGLLLLDEMVFIRVFGVGLDTQLQAYKPIAGVFHLRNTPASGHYRAFLCEAASAGVGENPDEPSSLLDRAFETDDGRPPRKLVRNDYDQVLTNAYLIWLLRVE